MNDKFYDLWQKVVDEYKASNDEKVDEVLKRILEKAQELSKCDTPKK